MTELAEHPHSDYLRWQDFDKTARVASHSAGGVIEPMPVGRQRVLQLRHVNGTPATPSAGCPR